MPDGFRLLHRYAANWLDVGDPALDSVMVERVAYVLAGMVGSLWQPGV